MQEVWKPIPLVGYEHKYEISNLGRLRSLGIRPKILSPRTYEGGYIKANLSNDGGRTKKLRGVHRLVALAFIPNPLDKECVNHLDNNPANNRADNLEWVTQQENVTYKCNQDRHAKGERINTSKLTEHDVLDILSKGRTVRIKDQAAQYRVSSGAILDILNGRTWKHLSTFSF